MSKTFGLIEFIFNFNVHEKRKVLLAIIYIIDDAYNYMECQ